jgi:alkylhydroperoxidase family enzyme
VVRAPDALRGLLGWGNYIQSKANDLPPRQKEIVILRIGYLCKAGYEWAQHAKLGKQAGLTEDEIKRLKRGAAGWEDADAALIRAADELHADQFIGDAVWTELCRFFSEKQRMDIVFTSAQYMQICMILNTFGVQLDPGLVLDPELANFHR